MTAADDSLPAAIAWRVFPWDPDAAPGAPFSAQYVPAPQGSGRFDLGGAPLVLYAAETPTHAVGEAIQVFRGRVIGGPHLRRHGHPLALIELRMPAAQYAALADLTEPAMLMRLGVRPDVLASQDRRRTQAAARAVHAAGYSGLRWWSALTGDWHSLVLFLDAVPPGELDHGVPTPLTTELAAVRDAAALLGIRLRTERP